MIIYIETIIEKERCGYGMLIKPHGNNKGVEYIGICSGLTDHNKIFKIALLKIRHPKEKEYVYILYNSKKVDISNIDDIPKNYKFEEVSNEKGDFNIVKELSKSSLKYPSCNTVLLHREFNEKNSS